MKQLTKLVRSNRKALGILVLGVGSVWIFRSQLGIFSEWVTDREAIVASIEQLGAWGPLLLFALLVLQVFLALIPGHALILAGSFAFGFWPSFLITMVSTVLGSQIAFEVARRWGRSTVYKLADRSVIERWDRLADRQGTLFYFFSFVLPIFPSDLMTYVAGLGTISSKRFFIANICGRTLFAGLFTLLGANSFKMPPIFWESIVVGMLILFVGWKAYAIKHDIQLFAMVPPKKNKEHQLS